MSEIQCKMSNSLNDFQEMVAMADFLDEVTTLVFPEKMKHFPISADLGFSNDRVG